MIPYRIDLAGAWLDQPFISKICPGSVITLSLEPIHEYHERCGMATSTRKKIEKIYSLGMPEIDSIEMAKLVFAYDNKPGQKYVSGAQDAIGLCVKGLSRHYYNGSYWPRSIEILQDDSILDWLEDHIFLKYLWPRPEGLDLMEEINGFELFIKSLSDCSNQCWDAILNKDLSKLGEYITLSFNVQRHIFPLMADIKIIEKIPVCMGCKLAGAGGGGYLIMINDKPCGDKIKIRR